MSGPGLPLDPTGRDHGIGINFLEGDLILDPGCLDHWADIKLEQKKSPGIWPGKINTKWSMSKMVTRKMSRKVKNTRVSVQSSFNVLKALESTLDKIFTCLEYDLNHLYLGDEDHILSPKERLIRAVNYAFKNVCEAVTTIVDLRSQLEKAAAYTGRLQADSREFVEAFEFAFGMDRPVTRSRIKPWDGSSDIAPGDTLNPGKRTRGKPWSKRRGFLLASYQKLKARLDGEQAKEQGGAASQKAGPQDRQGP